MSAGLVEQADGRSRRARGGHQFLKRAKHRAERRRAKRDPEQPALYTRFRGYET